MLGSLFAESDLHLIAANSDIWTLICSNIEATVFVTALNNLSLSLTFATCAHIEEQRTHKYINVYVYMFTNIMYVYPCNYIHMQGKEGRKRHTIQAFPRARMRIP